MPSILAQDKQSGALYELREGADGDFSVRFECGLDVRVSAVEIRNGLEKELADPHLCEDWVRLPEGWRATSMALKLAIRKHATGALVKAIEA